MSCHLDTFLKDRDAKYRLGTAYNPYIATPAAYSQHRRIDALDLFGRHGASRGFWLRRRMLEADTVRTEQDGLDR